jgi:cell division transport system permease protein
MYWSYGIPRALQSLRTEWRASLYSTLIIAAAFAILGIGVLLYLNVTHLSRLWLSNTSLSLFIAPATTPEQRQALLERVRGDPAARRVVMVSPEEGLRRLAHRLGTDPAVIQGVEAANLPYTIDFDLDVEERAHIREIAARYRQAQGVEEVVYAERELDKVRLFLRVVQGVGVFFVALTALAFWFIVSNSTKLSLYARREEIEILAAVGATRRVISSSFVVECVLLAGAGFLLAVAINGISYGLLVSALSWSEATQALRGRMVFFPPGALGVAGLATLALAGLGSHVSVRRLLRGIEG